MLFAKVARFVLLASISSIPALLLAAIFFYVAIVIPRETDNHSTVIMDFLELLGLVFTYGLFVVITLIITIALPLYALAKRAGALNIYTETIGGGLVPTIALLALQYTGWHFPSLLSGSGITLALCLFVSGCAGGFTFHKLERIVK